MLQNKMIDAVILAAGDYPSHERPLQILAQAPFVICCDGAAEHYVLQSHEPDLIVGDGDSLSMDMRERFADRFVYEPDQETNDQTKAVKHLMSLGKKHIAIVGATGKREDHSIGNIALLAEYQQMGVDVRMYTDYGVFIPCVGKQQFICKPSAQVSIFNINATNIEARGLAYPLYDFTQWWQGCLNDAPEGSFEISAQGAYIVFITYESK